jgi:hypothetical protein
MVINVSGSDARTPKRSEFNKRVAAKAVEPDDHANSYECHCLAGIHRPAEARTDPERECKDRDECETRMFEELAQAVLNAVEHSFSAWGFIPCVKLELGPPGWRAAPAISMQPRR